MRARWWIFGFVSAMALIALLQKLGVQPGGESGWWLIPLFAVMAGLTAMKSEPTN